MIIKFAFEKFILDREAKGLSPKSLRNYVEFNRKFLEYIGDLEMEVLDLDAVRQYAKSLNARKVSKATVAAHMRHIKAFLTWANEEFDLGFPVKKIPIPKTPKKDIHLYNAGEIRTIFQTVSGSVPWIKKRNQVIVALMLDSGLRQAEVCNVLLKDVDFTENVFKVVGKGGKERSVPFGKLAKRLIFRYQDVCPFESPYLLVGNDGKQLTGNAVKLLIQKTKRRVPFELSSHKLRHNFATNYCIDMYERKGTMDPYALMAILGHESMDTTMRYIHLAQEQIACKGSLSHLDMLNNLDDL